MTNAVDEHARPKKRTLNLHIPQFMRSRDATDDLHDFHNDVMLCRIALGITDLSNPYDAPWVARECQRNWYRQFGLPKPGRPFDGPAAPDCAEEDAYWFTAPNFWPDEKPFMLRIGIDEMQSRLAVIEIIKPDTETAVVEQNLRLLKKLLRMNNVEITFLTAAWAVSRSDYTDKHSPLSTALRQCRIGYAGPNETNERYAPMLAKILDAPLDNVRDLIARIRDLVALNFVDASVWHGEASNLFELLHLNVDFLEILETPHQNEKELEQSILDNGNNNDDTKSQSALIEHIVTQYEGDLKTAYIYSTLGEPLPAAAISALSNRLVDLGITASHVEPLADILHFDNVVMAARRSALKIRKISSRLNRYEFLKEFYQSERGLNFQLSQQASSD